MSNEHDLRIFISEIAASDRTAALGGNWSVSFERGLQAAARKTGKTTDELREMLRQAIIYKPKEDTAEAIVRDLVAACAEPSGSQRDVVDFMVELAKIVARARVWMNKAGFNEDC